MQVHYDEKQKGQALSTFDPDHHHRQTLQVALARFLLARRATKTRLYLLRAPW